jgi:hypothetical protein
MLSRMAARRTMGAAVLAAPVLLLLATPALAATPVTTAAATTLHSAAASGSLSHPRAGTASVGVAGPVEDAVAGLRGGPVFLDPRSGRRLDVDAMGRAIGGEPIKIAILPGGPGTSEVRSWPREISQRLPGNTVAVIAGRYFYAGSDVLCRGAAGQAATNAIARHNAELDADDNSDLTAALTDFVAELRAAPRCDTAGGAGRGDRYADDAGGGDVFAGADTASVLPWVLGGLALGVLGIGGWVLLSRRRAAARIGQRRGETRELVARLGAEVAALADGGPADGLQARADAAGKHGEAHALLAGATTDVQYAAIRHTAIEGLIAAAAARELFGAAGVNAGPSDAGGAPGQRRPIPEFDPPPAGGSAAPPPADLPHRPLAAYRPGASYYHPGSAAAPAGWYPEPFWDRSAEPPEPLEPAEPTGVAEPTGLAGAEPSGAPAP